jgi:hypothetical protein
MRGKREGCGRERLRIEGRKSRNMVGKRDRGVTRWGEKGRKSRNMRGKREGYGRERLRIEG